MFCQRFEAGPRVLFHNTLLARRGCVNTAPHPHLCPAVPRQAAMPAALCWVTDSSSSPPLPPALEAACWHPTGLVSTESLWLCRWNSSSENDARPRVWESKEHLPLGRELAWRLSLLCPLPLNLSAPIWVTLTVQLGGKRQSLPAQGRDGSSSITAALSSHPVAASSQLRLPHSQLQLITAPFRHVLVAFSEGVTGWCMIRPCL